MAHLSLEATRHPRRAAGWSATALSAAATTQQLLLLLVLLLTLLMVLVLLEGWCAAPGPSSAGA